MANENRRIANRYARRVSETRRLVYSIRNSARSRFVWFVAICGYVLFNAKDFWETLVGHPLGRDLLLQSSLPWIITAVLALIAHLLIDVVNAHEGKYYTTLVSMLDQFQLRNMEDVSSTEILRRIVRDEESPLPLQKRSLESRTTVTRVFERSAVGMMVFAFAWSVLWPATHWEPSNSVSPKVSTPAAPK